MRIAVRLAPFISGSWSARCFASLRAVSPVERVLLSEAPAAEGLDLVLDLSLQPIDPRQIASPRLGYWTFVYGEEPERINPGLKEFLRGSRAAFVRLVRLTRPESARVLREGVVKAVTHSRGATRERLLEAVVDWPAQQLRDTLREAGDDSHRPAAQLRQRPLACLLGLLLLLPFAWVRNVARRVVQEASREHWAVGVIQQPVHVVRKSFDPAAIRWLPAPEDGFIADPFGVALPGGGLSIMAEALSWKERRGRIVAFERRQDGSVTPSRDVLALASHASYPHLIEHAGEIYCVPETSQQRRVQLYRASTFPDQWVPDQVLLENFAGADATICCHAGRWWLFAGNHADQDETKLFIFHAPQLRGPWLPHAGNPVKCDLRSARPAGPLFEVGNELFRPAQDCSVTYGGAVVVNKIIRLTPEEFAEETVGRLAPAEQGPYPDGLHTLSGAGGMTLVDGKRHELSLASVAMALERLGRGLGRKLVPRLDRGALKG